MVPAKQGHAKSTDGVNSFVAPAPLREFQVDLFHFYYAQPERVNVAPEQPESGPRLKINRVELRKLTEDPPYGAMAIDIFAKETHAVPLKLSEGKDWRKALEEIIKTLGKPKVIYTDGDAVVVSNELQNCLKKNNVKRVVTKQYASAAERAIRYLKKRLSDKLEDASFRE